MIEPKTCELVKRLTQAFKTLLFLVRDRFASVLKKLRYLLGTHKFMRTTGRVRNQLFWLVDQLVQNQQQCEPMFDIVILFMRQIRADDKSKHGLNMANSLLNLLVRHAYLF